MTAAAMESAPERCTLTARQATVLLTQYPCCFLYHKGETRPDGRRATGKEPRGTAWQKKPRHADQWSEGTGVGVICGRIPERFPAAGLNVHCLDVDARDETLASRFEVWLLDYVRDKPGVQLKRTGKPPKFLVPFVCPDELSKSQYTTAKYYPREIAKDDGHANQLEVLGVGNQFVSYAVHPDTDNPYQWAALGRPAEVVDLHATPPGELLTLSRDDLATIKAAFAQLADECGLVLEPLRLTPACPTDTTPGESFFSKVNSKALHNLAAWFPEMFPAARTYHGGFRVSSADLGRGLQEDISAVPEGIQDFGEERTCSAIDVVLNWGAATTPLDAALWLCSRLGIDPTLLGWRGNHPPPACAPAPLPDVIGRATYTP